MIFYNDQGDENGGLVFDGGLKNGVPNNGGSLTFEGAELRDLDDDEMAEAFVLAEGAKHQSRLQPASL